MKKQSNTLLAPLVKADFNTLTAIVPETLAFVQKVPAAKSFTAAELWKIQRQKKAIPQRRFIF